MKNPLANIKDENGTSIQSHAEVFLEKADKAGFSIELLMMYPPDTLVLLGNIPTEHLSSVLNQIASQIKKKPDSHGSLQINPPETQIN